MTDGHERVVRRGAGALKRWRKANPHLMLDLAGADLRRCNLSGLNLANADLSHADLQGTNFSGANLTSADVSRANLHGANLQNAQILGIRGLPINKPEAKIGVLICESKKRKKNVLGSA